MLVDVDEDGPFGVMGPGMGLDPVGASFVLVRVSFTVLAP